MRPLLLFAFVLLAACASDPDPAAPASTPEPAAASTDDSVVGIVGTNSQLSTLSSALEPSGLAETLSNPDAAYTLFAPSNDAFAALPDADRTALLADPARLSDLLRAHTIATRMLSPDIIDGLTIETLGGSELTLASDGQTVRVTNASGVSATVVTPDLDTSNGVVHIIDTVLSP